MLVNNEEHAKTKSLRQEMKEHRNKELDKHSDGEMFKYQIHKHRVGLLSIGWFLLGVQSVIWIVHQAPIVTSNLIR